MYRKKHGYADAEYGEKEKRNNKRRKEERGRKRNEERRKIYIRYFLWKEFTEILQQPS